MFWDNLFHLCMNKGIKPNALVDEIGVSSGIITKWKNGTTPNGETLKKIADYFDVSVDYLLGRTDKPELLAAHTADDSHDLTPEQREELEQFKQFIIQRDKNKR